MTDDSMDSQRQSGDATAALVDVVLDFLDAAGSALRDSRSPERELLARAEIESAVMWVVEPLAPVLPAGPDNLALTNAARETSVRVAATIVAAAYVLAASETTFDSTVGDVTGREFTSEVIRAVRRQLRT